MDVEILFIIIAVMLGVLICAALAIANYAFDRFVQLYGKYDNISLSYCPGILNFINDVCQNVLKKRLNIYKTDKPFGDSYGGGALFLSERTLSSSGLASYAIIAHELGHAVQDATTKRLKRHHFLAKLGKVVSVFILPCLIAGVILLFFRSVRLWGIILCAIGVAIFAFAILLKFLVISIEKDASKIALTLLEPYLTQKELKIARKFLASAKLTYWADLFRALFGWTMLTRKTKLFN